MNRRAVEKNAGETEGKLGMRCSDENLRSLRAFFNLDIFSNISWEDEDESKTEKEDYDDDDDDDNDDDDEEDDDEEDEDEDEEEDDDKEDMSDSGSKG